MTKEEKVKLIDGRIEFYKKEIEALERIKSGEPEAKVLRDLNINQRSFRYRNYKAVSNNTYEEDKEYWSKNDLFLSPEEKLFCDITEDNDLSHIPYTIKENVDEVLSAFPYDKGKKVINMLYFEGYSMNDAAKELNVTNGYVSYIRKKAIRKLRYPSRINILRRNITTEKLNEIRISNEISDVISEKVEEFMTLINDIETLSKVTKESITNIANAAELAIDKSIGILNNDSKDEFSSMVFNKTPIEELDLSVRSYNCLKRAKIETIGDIFKASTSLAKTRNLGERSYKETIEKLSEYLNKDIESLYDYFGEFQYPNNREPVIKLGESEV